MGSIPATNARTGKIRCSARSFKFPSARGACMPPVGNQVTRRANANKPRAIRMSGVPSKKVLPRPETRSSQRPARDAIQTPSGIAISHEQTRAVMVKIKVLAILVSNNGQTGQLYAKEYPNSPRETDRSHRAYLRGRA